MNFIDICYNHFLGQVSPAGKANQDKMDRACESSRILSLSVAVGGVALGVIGIFSQSIIAFAIGALVAVAGHEAYRISENLQMINKSVSTSVKIYAKNDPSDEILKDTLILNKLPKEARRNIACWISHKAQKITTTI